MKSDKILWKGIWPYLRKLHGHLSFNPTIPILGIYSEDTHPIVQNHTHKFIKALFVVIKF